MASAAEKEVKKLALAELKAERETLYTRVQRAHDLALVIDDKSEQFDQFMGRCEILRNSLKEFENLLKQCKSLEVDLNPDYDVIQIQELLDLFENMYFKTIGVYNRLKATPQPVTPMNTYQPNSTMLNNSSFVNSTLMNVPLPQIKIKPFDGTLQEWPEFKATFTSLYHENPMLTPIAKFHYLRAHLRGSALTSIRDLPLTETNYTIAWKQLNKMYENDRMLGADLLHKLMNFPEVKRESMQELSSFVATFSECFAALQALPILDLTDFVILHIGLKCLPLSIQKAFERSRDMHVIPKVQDLMEFVHKQTQVLALCDPKPKEQKAQTHSNSNGNKKPIFSSTFAAVTAQNRSKFECPLCSQNHLLYQCSKFLKEPVENRFSFVKSKALCWNCLRPNHFAPDCQLKATCKVCKKRHNSLIHLKSSVTAITSHIQVPEIANQSTMQPTGNTESEMDISKHPCILAHTSQRVLLGTAQIRIKGKNNKFIKVRAAIDSCAMDSFITTKCVQRLGLHSIPSDSQVTGLSELPVSRIEGAVDCLIKPLASPEPKLTTRALVIPQITTNLPVVAVPDSIIAAFQHLNLADNQFAQPHEIEFLIGCDLFPHIYTGNKIQSTQNGPFALESIFGWVITGKYTVQNSTLKPIKIPALPSLFINVQDPIDQALRKFWEIEDIKVNIPLHPDDKLCNDTFDELHYRENSGRYVVPLMLKPNTSELGNSYDQALSRWLAVEKRLGKNPELKLEYTKFMTEYEHLGHMTRVPDSKLKQGKYYIPHHAVFRDSSTTRVRCVFDGSMKTTNGISLNDILLPGPKLQLDIIDVLCRFRLHKIVFCADICKMYRQFLILPEHRSYQHILWRPEPDSEILEFQLATITYGTTSAPYTAIKTMHQIGHDQRENRPQLEKIIQEELFVDDFLTGQPTVEKARELKNEMIAGLNEANLELRKFASNSPELLADIPPDHIEAKLNFSEDNSIKVLGVQWLASPDCFSFKIDPIDIVYTRRSILSACAKLFDPLGLLSVIIVKFKIILKKTWLLGLDWDQEVPDNLKQEWCNLANSLPQLSKLKIPRHVLISNNVHTTLIGFADASMDAYRAVTYLKTEDELGNCQINILLAKSKIAPVKTVSVPNLELCGSFLLSKLIYKIRDLYTSRITIHNCFAFTDSMVTLCWIKTLPCYLKTFVANRVTYILEKTEPTIWHHISGDQNPADLISRGCQVAEILNSKFWWEGPEWLKLPTSQWPTNQDIKASPDSNAGLKREKTTTLVTSTEPSIIGRYSSYTKLKRITALLLRFCHNAKTTPEKRWLGNLSTDELAQAEHTLIRSVQKLYFKDELTKLRKGHLLPKHFRKLDVKLRKNNLLRVRGRLVEAAGIASRDDPILLPKNSIFTKLLINSYHKTYLHVGPRTLQSLLCRKYWILSARQVIRSCLSKCVPCFKARPTLLQPKMGVLPKPRVNQGRPWTSVGTDFGGPYHTKDTSLRKARTIKSYICLFICLATKAIHIELVSALSTVAFIAAFDRFIGRRGLPKHVYSDCGSNYIGANNQLNEVYKFLSKKQSQSDIQRHAADMEITWHFQPASAPTFGGAWESGIKSIKYHLKRTIGDQLLTFEEMTTVLVKIEAMLNSRPLCPASDDPTELDGLTSGHLITGGPLVARPEREPSDNIASCRDRWRLISTLSHHFWNRWTNEYLHTLTQRAKWTKDQENIKLGQLVLISDSHLPPTQWALGRVEEVFPGKDNIVRVVKLKTKSGVICQPVNKLAPLPIDSDPQDKNGKC